ncbi:tRNA-uridine aminocarboxypropyltransferase 1 isoform X2 [Tachysurus vachellii]|uniref:tRNA-uridine aminocarboxypropyltransferase 1 isoform X2 n=1 Tax=Tachysurus vachellii TaxID=175792 RepID=UPI00296AB8EB|nr:tRNA-uridine aminocarboxypropyltransferase 1 isoform X2 [Tachysurus vachellii]
MSQTGQDLGKNVKKDHGLADGSGDSVKKKNEEDDDEDPLQGLVLSPHTVLDEAHHTGRLKCSTCGSSRLLYCYTCCCLVGLNPQLIPNIKVVLVFPGPNSMTVQEMVDYIRKNRRKRGAEKSAEERDTKKPKLEETSDSSQSHSHTHSHTHSGTQMSQNTQQTEDHMCQVQRVIFIDSTWNQTTKIISDERLQDFPRVELKSRKTCFWRHQRGSPDSYLATIEAIYYFLKDFHIHCLQREYRGEYDNLLFFYTFLHKLIRKAKQSTV